MTTTAAARFHIINSMDGSIHVHRAGCADITRRELDRANSDYVVTAKSGDAAFEAEIEALRADFGDEADDFTGRVYPCCKKA